MIIRPAHPKVLYIDDDPVNRSLVNRLLSVYEFEVIEAASGLEGITLARKDPPHLILMDINLPGLDGHETTTRMRGIPALEQIPIIAITARTTAGERELALAAGCDGYIPKPINVDSFANQIISYLEGYRDTITNAERQYYLGQYSHKLVEHLEAKVIELQEANTRLQKIDKLKSDFITLAAHELRTPITLVYGYARLLQAAAQESERSELPLDENAADLAGKIFHSVHRLNEVVNDILNVSLIQAKQMQLRQEQVYLVEIIKAALSELNPTKSNRMLHITLQGLDTLPPVLGDRERLRQAFWNILSNAIKYTPDGGSISIQGQRVNLSPDKPSTITSFGHEHEGVIILVKDTGLGLDPSEQKDVFEQFYVVGDIAYHSSSKTAFKGGGIGLGLPITRGIIEAHGGRVWVESAGRDVLADPGAKFYVLLPLKGSPIVGFAERDDLLPS